MINGNYKLLKLKLSFVLRKQWNECHYFQAKYKCLYIVAQLDKAIKAINEDELNLTYHCRFYRLYQLPCSHI